MTPMRFYQRDLPVVEFAESFTPLPEPGRYVRFAADEPAWLVESVVQVYAKDGEVIRLDIAITDANPGNIPPFPQITRAPSDLVPIPSLEPPEEKERAET